MYIYHSDNILRELVFRTERLNDLLEDLNNDPIVKGLQDEKNGFNVKFDWTYVRLIGDKIAGATPILIEHDSRYMSFTGRRNSSNHRRFWEFVEKHGLQKHFEKYIPAEELNLYVESVKASKKPDDVTTHILIKR